LGAKYGGKLSEIIKAVRGNRFEIKGNNLTVEINGEKLTLGEDDVLVNYNAKSGLHVMSGGGIVVALDLTVTEELKREGVARELVRNIQDARKQLSCDMTERIEVCFKGERPPEEWLEYICGETLSNLSDFDDFDTQCEIAGNDGKIFVGIKRTEK
jgi:isoleucyl-tRNA synthetase